MINDEELKVELGKEEKIENKFEDDNVKKKIDIDEDYVLKHLSKTLKGSNLKKYIL